MVLNEEGQERYSEACIAPFIPLRNDQSFKTEYELLKAALMAPQAHASELRTRQESEKSDVLSIPTCGFPACGKAS